MTALIPDQGLSASIPGHGSFSITGNAVDMIEVFGGLLHCYQGSGGCRKQGLYFSRTEPKKPLRCLLHSLSWPGSDSLNEWNQPNHRGIVISVSHELAPKLDGAVLDFGTYNKMQRFVWLSMPAVKGPACTCLRSIGPAAGKRSPCLDDQGIGLSDL
ncbi:peptidase [Arthrobacter glacialis]|uniref:Peptidase n=1 Tax=Arthrobacter glacialis TaxID=1664 RepID=A0A2S3ZTS8_ARTGL|nr:peptidase [Arthrobacter glacialis]POH72494.1 peptidase [Arthrobacter glacialis]